MSGSQETSGANIYAFPSRPDAVVRLFQRRLELDVQGMAISPVVDVDAWYHDEAIAVDHGKRGPRSH